MANFSEHIVNKRFKELFERLEILGVIKGKSDLAKILESYNHVINNILQGKRNITVDQLLKLFEVFNVNANYMFGMSELMFKDGQVPNRMDIPSVSIYDKQPAGRSSIVLVDDKVRAGYALEHQDKSYLDKLPTFSLPNIDGLNLVAFEIDGDSMMPTLTNGDLVVCEPLERDEPIYDNRVYVIVTDVLVAKRVQQLKTEGELTALRLISDNSQVYRPYEVLAEDIRQILRVKCRLTKHAIN